MFNEEHLSKIKEGIILFNEQKYWECHEALEEMWLEDRQDPVRNIYWAIIQVAAACIHYRDSNLIGCIGMINKAKEKFKKTHELHVLSDLVYSKLSWHEFESIVLKIPKDPKLEDFQEIYNFRFKSFLSDK